MDPLTYSWGFFSKPEGSTALLLNPSTVNPSFVADLPGIYGVALVVNDGLVNSESDNVTIVAVSGQGGTEEVEAALMDAISIIKNLDKKDFFRPNRQKSLINKINAVLSNVDGGNFGGAHSKLNSDILPKMDGCAVSGASDSNDWIITCEAQDQVNPHLLKAVTLLENLP